MKTTLNVILLSAVLLTSCQSLKKEEPIVLQPGAPQVGQWEAKAMIKSMETGEASVVTLDVIGQKPTPMRVEVTTSLGIALASILMKAEEVEYIIPKQKKYYHGPLSETSLLPVLKIKVDPRILSAAFFEEAYPQWSCQADHGLLSMCQIADGVQLKWDREDPASKRVSISSPNFDIQVQIKKYTAKAEFPKNALELKVPESYKKYKLK